MFRDFVVRTRAARFARAYARLFAPGSLLPYFRLELQRNEEGNAMGRKPYADDVGASEFAGDGQYTSDAHGAAPGVGVVPGGAVTELLGWYWTNPADPASAPEPDGRSIGDQSVLRNRPQQ